MKVLVVTGASGGHIFPALAFLDNLKAKSSDAEMLLVLPSGNFTGQIKNFTYPFRYICISPIKLNVDFKNLLAILKFFQGSLESLLILLSFRPDKVVAFGSIASVPLVLLARILKIKTLIHEQNVLPGQANRFLARFADRIAVSFSQTQRDFKRYLNKTIFTGNPLRKELKKIGKLEALKFFGFGEDKFTILVMGGSQGSHRINAASFRAVSSISQKYNFQIIHLAGTKDFATLRDNYKSLNVRVRLFSFLRDIDYAYNACDLVISRAGATSIAEIINFQLPAVIIPYPYAYKHQSSNAAVLKKAGCAVVIEDSELDSGILKKTIEDFIENPDKIRSMHAQYRNLSCVNPETRLTDAVISL